MSFKNRIIFDIEKFFQENYGLKEDMEWVDMNPLQRKISDQLVLTYESINKLFKLVT